MKRSLLSILLILGVFHYAGSQVVINEFSASNSGNIVDPDYGNSADWIELFNSGDYPVNLNGYSITDNFTLPSKWIFSTDIILEPESYLIIWCDGMSNGLHTNFKLSAEGEEIAIFDANGTLLDSLSYTGQESNISMGRVCDGCSDWVFFTEATPGTSNVGVNYKGLVQNEPYFYPMGGIFNKAVEVEIRNLFEGVVRYTTDGSEPTILSPLYEKPLLFDSTTILRARIFREQDIKPGKISTHSYFIDLAGTIGTLPLISLVSEPANFWDSQKGIYVQNFKPEWEIPVNIELFENDGSDRASFNLPAGTKINGLYSWQLPQKMLGIYFRKRYGAGKLDYPLFFDKKATRYDSFALRASGNDWSRTLFRDGMLQNSTSINTGLDVQGYRPCVVFINGRYMGIHNIRSKVDANFIVNEQLPEGSKIDMIENENVIEEGSISAYNQFKSLYKKDLSNTINFDSVAAIMDIPLFVDYMVTELYGGNSSIGHNIMSWKPIDSGKWKWIPVDLDRCMFDPDENLTDFFLGKTVYPFPSLMKNVDFVRQFRLRLADQLMTTFNPQRMSQFIDNYANRIREELPRHIQRWEGTSSSYGNPIPTLAYWERSMAQMKTFAYQRPVVVLNDMLNYGQSQTVPLSVGVRPASGAVLTLNSLTIPLSSVTGSYPQGESIHLTAKSIQGYRLKGWKVLTDTVLIPRGDIWKYYDKGNGLPSDWKEASFDDSNWAEGAAELGYGDGDEATRVSFGSSSSNKFITTYFRKSLQINDISIIELPRFSMKIDDGAVLYVNGKEAARFNIAAGEVTYSTLAAASVPNATIFQNMIVPIELFHRGNNVIAVEVHQNLASSSDISFNLELRAGIIPDRMFTTQSTVELTINQASYALALFEDQGLCMIPDTIASTFTLTKQCSPYYTRGDIVITPTGKLQSEPGVEIRMAQHASLQVQGSLQLKGSTDEPIRIVANREAGVESWGAIIARNATDTMILEHVVIEDASRGSNPTTEDAAISLFHSTAYFNTINITKVNRNPILAKYSNVTLINSQLHSKVTGDLINVKYGKATIASCVFRGNDQPDTDAIDYDDVEAGVIRTSIFHDFHGFNSDAIDIGEQAKGILIDSVFIYNISDKGISVGQQSSVMISNAYIINCNLGIAAKDSSHVTGDRITFYGCGIPVASYEKNIGSAGGNVMISRSILSNSNEQHYELDSKSTLGFISSYTDASVLPDSLLNFKADPLFESPGEFNFKLKSNSLLLDKDGKQVAGAFFVPSFELPVMPVISTLYIGDADAQDAEFIMIENPGTKTIDLSGYRFINGIEAEFVSPTLLEPGQQIILTNMPDDSFWNTYPNAQLLPYSTGRLNNTGEKLSLATTSGIIIDQLNYSPDTPWPPYRAQTGMAIRLKKLSLDNHFGYNWELVDKNAVITANNNQHTYGTLRIYPNPASDYLELIKNTTGSEQLSIYSLAGICVYQQLYESGRINISTLKAGIYIVRIGNNVERLIIQP